MTANLTVVRIDPLRVQAENQLRDAITSGKLAPGQKLIERELCEALGISRPSLREALRRLEAEKLIVNIPHRGPMVATVSVDEAREMYALRRLLEGHAAAECARHASDAQLEQLDKAVAQLRSGMRRKSRPDILKAKQQFYGALLDGCGNALLAELLGGLLSRISLLRSASLLSEGRLPESLREIEAMLAAIVRRDANKAQKLAAEHVSHAEQAAMAVLCTEKKAPETPLHPTSLRRKRS